MMKKRRMMAYGLGLALLTGCSTVNDPYIPQTVGARKVTEPRNGVGLFLQSGQEVGRLGEPLTLEVTLRNNGATDVWIPADPQLVLLWVYPNGRHDNFVVDLKDRQHFTQRNAVLLKVGEILTKQVRVETHYFPRAGITEFRAVLQVPHCTNPELTPFWAGRAISNAYGILMVDRDDPYASTRRLQNRHDRS